MSNRILTKQIKRLRNGKGYAVLRRNGTGLGYIYKVGSKWEVRLDGANNCDIPKIQDTFTECQCALIKSGICDPR